MLNLEGAKVGELSWVCDNDLGALGGKDFAAGSILTVCCIRKWVRRELYQVIAEEHQRWVAQQNVHVQVVNVIDSRPAW